MSAAGQRRPASIRKMFGAFVQMSGSSVFYGFQWPAGVSDNRLQNVVITLDKVKLCLERPGEPAHPSPTIAGLLCHHAHCQLQVPGIKAYRPPVLSDWCRSRLSSSGYHTAVMSTSTLLSVMPVMHATGASCLALLGIS